MTANVWGAKSHASSMSDPPEALEKLWDSVWSSPDSEPAVESRIGETLDGKFELLGLIGRGGMGTVYHARNTWTNDEGALKLLKQPYAMDGEAVARFRREAMASNAIKSPLIVKTLDAGRLTSGEAYLFMELLEGSTLSQHLYDLRTAGTTMSLEEAIKTVSRACEGLAVAHARGVIHRDIKPDNLFLSSDGNVKILDFGIAKFRRPPDQRTLETRAIMGTPGYMAPEQVVSTRDVDERADVYALGVVLYECLTGHRPFEEEPVSGSGGVPPVSTRRPDLPFWLSATVARAMALNPAERFPSAGALAEALARYADAESLSRSDTAMSIPPPSDPTEAIAGATDAAANDRGGATAAVAGSSTSERRSRRRGAFALAVISLAVGLTLAVWRLAGGSSPAPAPLRFRLGVAPPTASVEVDGKPAAVIDGTILLVGKLGETRVVRLRTRERTLVRNVSFTAEGLLPPSVVLELPAPLGSGRALETSPSPAASAPRVQSRVPPPRVTASAPGGAEVAAPVSPPTTLDKLKKTFE